MRPSAACGSASHAEIRRHGCGNFWAKSQAIALIRAERGRYAALHVEDKCEGTHRARVASLAELLAARELREFPLTRHCEIGPFVVECLFAEQALIVELAPSEERQKFLTAMGYGVLAIDPRELIHHPRRALRRLRAALKS